VFVHAAGVLDVVIIQRFPA